MRRLVAASLLSMAMALPALGHQGGHRAYGVVKEVTAIRLVVTDEHGKDTAFALTPGTRLFRDHRAIGREEVRVGERVVVQGKDVDGRLEAATVDLGAPPKPAR